MATCVDADGVAVLEPEYPRHLLGVNEVIEVYKT
jgi:hypothetical protein